MDDKMYNETAKTMFMDSLNLDRRSRNNIIRIFRRSASEERRLGKDLCNWTSSEFVAFYKQMNSVSLSYLLNCNNIFDSYCMFCLSKNMVMDGQNHTVEINREVIKSCLNKVAMKQGIVTREQLLDHLGNLLNPGDKFLILGIFEGINGNGLDEALRAKISDIEGDKLTLFTGREITISPELKKFAIESERTYEFYPYSKNMNAIVPLKKYPGYIVKPLNNSSKDPEESYVNSCRLNKIMKAADLFSVTNRMSIRKSGIIHLIRSILDNRTDRETVSITKDEEIVAAVRNQFDFDLLYNNIFMEQYEEYLR